MAQPAAPDTALALGLHGQYYPTWMIRTTGKLIPLPPSNTQETANRYPRESPNPSFPLPQQCEELMEWDSGDGTEGIWSQIPENRQRSLSRAAPRTGRAA